MLRVQFNSIGCEYGIQHYKKMVCTVKTFINVQRNYQEHFHVYDVSSKSFVVSLVWKFEEACSVFANPKGKRFRYSEMWQCVLDFLLPDVLEKLDSIQVFRDTHPVTQNHILEDKNSWLRYCDNVAGFTIPKASFDISIQKKLLKSHIVWREQFIYVQGSQFPTPYLLNIFLKKHWNKLDTICDFFVLL